MGKGKITAVIGGQYGSEGKGVIVQHISNKYDMHVRVGSPNAGHTFYWQGDKHVMQSIPCGWINPDAIIVIGRGALINMELLMNEIKHIQEYYPDFTKRLFIDANAGVLDEVFHQEEGGTEGELHQRIGSTGEGVGAARIARIQRDTTKFRLFHQVAHEYGLERTVYDNTPLLMFNSVQYRDCNLLLEGTQGSGLSLLHSHYPYCTSIDTNAAQILAECGIAPSMLDEVILVCRTYPIRVAGNSGYMKDEISWDEISAKFGRDIIEKTTVTKKVRRIGMWDDELVKNAIILNAPSSIALTFADYIDPSIEGTTDRLDLLLSDEVDKFITHIEEDLGVVVSMVGTGGATCSVVDKYDI